MSKKIWFLVTGVLVTFSLRSEAQTQMELREPKLVLPWCAKPPKIDGKLSPGEWDFAAGISMLEAYPCYWPRAMRQEQPTFYIFRDENYLYVAMESLDSSTTGIVAACAMNDNIRIIGDDCVELMIAPGAGEKMKEYDFPTYYFAFNSLGTIWDCKFVPLLNESHNAWQSGAEIANYVEGTYWSCEIKIPLASIRKEIPQEGETWRMNFDRTYAGYNWSAWNAGGGLNDCRVGGDVTFDRTAPAVRMKSVKPLIEGKLQLVVEVANGTDKAKKVKAEIVGSSLTGQKIGSEIKEMTVVPGEVKEVTVGKGEKLDSANLVAITATDESGRILYFIERQVNVPSPWFVKRPAPKVPLVYIFPRFLPSRERLAVLVDYTAFAKKTGFTGQPVAEIKVWRKGEEDKPPVLQGTLKEFKEYRGSWRTSTANLPEGQYSVKVQVFSGSGKEILVDYDDWFEKKIFDWMKNPVGLGEEVPEPYTPLQVKGNEVQPWGRAYQFSPDGLLQGISSQERQWLTERMEMVAEVEGKKQLVKVIKPFSFTSQKPVKVIGEASLQAGHLRMKLEAITEYDGFLLYRLTYGPVAKQLQVNRLRVKIPLAAKYCLFYSAAGDTQGTCIQADLLPQKSGKLYDSLENTRSVCCSPTFASLFWVGDHDISFCYASDSDKGWLIRDDAPAVEAWREGETVNLWLNLVDKPFTLTKPRTLEFAFQAGPTKPLPKGWRGIQDSVHPTEAPIKLVQVGGSGNPMPGGGLCFIHPGVTKEEQKRSREYLEKFVTGGDKYVIGYTFWPKVPKGFPETRVFRGEWGIDKQTWESATGPAPDNSLWKTRFFGENKERYVYFDTGGRPSYVDFLTYAYDLALKTTPLCGTYDDCGYPNPIYDEELGFGFIREDGKKIWSSGLWNYRERWKRAQYVNYQNKKINFLSDSQHCHAHFLPAYNFIGLWRPCERGYYNPFKDRDNLEFYGSLERYAAYNPAKQTGQIAQVGMSSPQSDPELKARDTRCMMMLALLNDHDLGSWNAGGRDGQVIGSLRAAKNRFRPWEKEVSFVGYWENSQFLQVSPENIRVSFYRRPDSLLLLVGNVGPETITAWLRILWEKLDLDPRKLVALDAETNQPLTLSDLKVEVKRHDLRVILVAPAHFLRGCP
ncbi:MAG: carbohydrate-binding family 9-like protein [Candidatus Omnitrophica bacterium]|nr:carbohydrate-binding family 9-like protein [Candidatus Omnitrophota bacterium]